MGQSQAQRTANEVVAVPNGRVSFTRLGVGTAPLAGMYRRVKMSDARSVVEVALRLGIGTFDTAPLYGYGEAERRLGAALAHHPGNSAVVSTKVGRLVQQCVRQRTDELFVGSPPGTARFDFTPAGVRASFEGSLERLGRAPDVVYAHDPDDDLTAAANEAIPTLVEWREAGAIRAVGVGTNDPATLTRLIRSLADDTVDVVLIAGRLSLLDPFGAREVLKLCTERQIGVVVGGVFNGGLLADPDSTPFFDYRPASQLAVRRARRMRDLCEHHGVDVRAAAIQYPLRHDGVTSIVVGVRHADELSQLVTLLDEPIPEDVWEAIDRHLGAHSRELRSC